LPTHIRSKGNIAIPKGKQKEFDMAGSDKKATGKSSFQPPKINVRVVSAKAAGNKVTVEFSKKQKSLAETTGRVLKIEADRQSLVVECSSPEHADLLAQHVTKLGTRKRKSGLVWTIRRLATDHDRLLKARNRAAKMKIRRDKDRDERAEYRRLAEIRQQKWEEGIRKGA
jgi:hypothetical protein